jgi:hypothetical protein
MAGCCVYDKAGTLPCHGQGFRLAPCSIGLGTLYRFYVAPDPFVGRDRRCYEKVGSMVHTECRPGQSARRNAHSDLPSPLTEPRRRADRGVVNRDQCWLLETKAQHAPESAKRAPEKGGDRSLAELSTRPTSGCPAEAEL